MRALRFFTTLFFASFTAKALASGEPSYRADLCWTLPVPGDFRWAVLSDLNSSYGSLEYEPRISRAVAQVKALHPQLVLVTGDMVAGQWRNLSEEHLSRMWELFHRTITQPLYVAGIALAVTPGNHDAAPGFETDRRVFARQWRSEVSGGVHPSLTVNPELRLLSFENYPFRYSFSWRDHLFVSLEATAVGPLKSEQKAWLRQELQRTASLKIVFGHLPLRSVAQGREKESLFDRDLEGLFEETGVSLYLAGHHHAFYPASLRDRDLFQVVTGALGQGPRKLIGSSVIAPASFTVFEWSQGGDLHYASCTEESPDRWRAQLLEALPEHIPGLDRLDLSKIFFGIRETAFKFRAHLSGMNSINEAMIEGDPDRHHGSNDDLAVFGDRFFANSPNRE